MSKYIIEYGVPFLLLGFLTYKGVLWWYLNKFGNTVNTIKEVNKASSKYDKEVNKK